MDNAKVFLLKKIIGYKTNGCEKLGSLNAEFVEVISNVMTEFAQATVMEVVNRINKGESIDLMNGYTLSFPEAKAINRKVKKAE